MRRHDGHGDERGGNDDHDAGGDGVGGQGSGAARERPGGPVRLAVVGLGYFAQSAVLPAFAHAKNCRLQALFSDDAEKLDRLGKKHKVAARHHTDAYDEVLSRGDIDAVYIALPNDMHADFTIRAAAAGVHVLCEKPMAVTAAEGDRMIAACDQAGVKLMVAYRLHFEAANLSTIDVLSRGRVGEPRFFSSVFSQQVAEGNTRTRADHGGGPLLDLGVYCINAARYLFRDEPIEAAAFTATRRDDVRFREIEEQIAVVLRFPRDRLAQFTCGFGAAEANAYEVVGTKGRVRRARAYDVIDTMKQEITVGGRTRTRRFPRRDQIASELIYFADCILHDKEIEPSGREGLADLRIIEAIRLSASEGVCVPLESMRGLKRPSATQNHREPPVGKARLVHAEAPTQKAD